jgi:N utilization substance protein B
MGRKIARESTMKLLYQMDLNNDYSDKIASLFFDNIELSVDEKEYVEHAVKNIRNNLKHIDNIIQKHTHGWNIYRIAKVDLAILRIAVYEQLYREDIPIEVSINEAIEIGKKYSTEESSKFINGILGSFARARDDKNE